MRVGFIGLGKLGLPSALVLAKYGGHSVVGFDNNPKLISSIALKSVSSNEPQLADLLRDSPFKLGSLDEVVAHSEVLFIAVQTPHEAKFDGTHELSGELADFDYTYLAAAVSSIIEAANRLDVRPTIAVISTVLPGTTLQRLLPIIPTDIHLVYNPYFIAMGSVVTDILDPEFVLLGSQDAIASNRVAAVYAPLHSSPVIAMDYTSAELVKMSYNTLIGLKIAFANTLMEICEKMHANCDDVTDALSKANKRLISPRYLRGGMGDGGGCHPRDNIAMSFLASQLNLSYDIFGAAMVARANQSRWLAGLAISEARQRDLPIVILGGAFKPEVDLTDGSPSLLLLRQLEAEGWPASCYDPVVDPAARPPNHPAVYILATGHDAFASFDYPQGSVVIDPLRKAVECEGVTVRRIGAPRELG